MTRVHVCPKPGCPELEPCPQHSRPRNARWSTDRDGAAQNRFARAVLKRDGHRCQHCGSTRELSAHHIRPGTDDISWGITLCASCHRSVDAHAR